ncbi:MAG: hypothetical protein MPF33_05855 [Candidatus Aramenus sp.]|nr:hypothetical protein [Candidatus Aramenus sp.]
MEEVRDKKVLGVNAQAVFRRTTWSSFSSLKQKPSFANHFSPPRYWKDGGKEKLILVVRQDRYEVDEEKRVISLKDWKMKMPFEG